LNCFTLREDHRLRLFENKLLKEQHVVVGEWKGVRMEKITRHGGLGS